MTPVVPERGYPKLATIMGPYKGMALFKRFAALNARNLLYMQAELLELQRQLDMAASFDREEGYSYDVEALALIKSDEEDEEQDDASQWQLFLKIRRKLKEYSQSRRRPKGFNAQD